MAMRLERAHAEVVGAPAGVGERAAQHLPPQHARQPEVPGVTRPARDLLGAIFAGHRFAHHSVGRHIHPSSRRSCSARGEKSVMQRSCLRKNRVLQQFFTPYPDSHHDTLRLHGALVQGEVSFSRCISSYCTTGWRLPPLLSLSIIVTFIDMNNRAARPLMLHAARPLTLCINGVYISAALERIDTTT